MMKKTLRMRVIDGIRLSPKSARKVQEYLDKYGEFEAYNAFGGRTVTTGVRNMIRFYKKHPEAPV